MNKLISVFSFFMLVCGNVNAETPAIKSEVATAAINATYKVTTVWATTFETIVTLTNNGTTPTSSWTATFTLPKNYVLSSHRINGIFSLKDQKVTVKNVTGNAVIAPGKSTTFTMLIEIPRGSPTVIEQLQASAEGSTNPTPPTNVPKAPVLNAISGNDANYTLSWNTVGNATSYALYESTTANFSNQKVIADGNILSKVITDKPEGIYYYRVLAKNTKGPSPYSNSQMIEIQKDNTPIPPINAGIEHSAWYITWTSWFNGPPFNIPTNVNMLNVFVGKIAYGADGKPTMDGFESMTPDQMKKFSAYCKAQNPSIAVKVSIGGGGGSYDRCWDVLTDSNVQAFAQGMADFCVANNVVGVDFDYEAAGSEHQQELVGKLIKAFKTINPNFQTSFCTNAGFGPNFPWQEIVKTVFDAAMISENNCAVDRLYIMSYYDPIESEKTWVTGWANWAIQNYGFTPARISVGIDDFDAHAYDPDVFKAWADSQGYSWAHWAFDPAQR
jgi:hypothetical protein